MTMIDAAGVVQVGRGQLFIGGALPDVSDVFDRFDHVVFAASERQPAKIEPSPGAGAFSRCLLDDADPALPGQIDRAYRCASHVASLVASGKKVLVTCFAGRNRSGLIVALAMSILFPWMRGASIIEHIQTVRPNALSNESFVRAILKISARRRRSRRPAR